jgi:hypothetical protein
VDFVLVCLYEGLNFKLGEKFQSKMFPGVLCSVMFLIFFIYSCILVVHMGLCHCLGG